MWLSGLLRVFTVHGLSHQIDRILWLQHNSLPSNTVSRIPTPLITPWFAVLEVCLRARASLLYKGELKELDWELENEPPLWLTCPAVCLVLTVSLESPPRATWVSSQHSIRVPKVSVPRAMEENVFDHLSSVPWLQAILTWSPDSNGPILPSWQGLRKYWAIC